MTRLHTFLLVVFFGSVGSFVSASERWETLRAINMVENPTNQTGYGSKGELGPYQFRSGTWRAYTRKPFKMANDRATADQVAVQHYEWIKDRLAAVGIDPNSYNIALAWNCGLSAVISGKIPMQSYHYAERVNNLTDDFRRNEVEASVAVVVTTKEPSSSTAALDFNLSKQNAAPEFKIVAAPFRFRVSNETPRYVIAPTAPRFVLVAN